MRKLTVEEYKACVLNVLEKIDYVCRENGYTYMICYGTLLGAVRHKGFIPWDDDIDIVMPREDYYKLGSYIIEHPELELNYIDISNRNDTFYYCAKVCDSKTIVKEGRYRELKGYGAFVDIFPLDYLPEDNKERERYCREELFWERIVQHSAELTPGKSENYKQEILKKLAFVFSRLFSSERILRKMHQRYIEFDKIKTAYIGIPWDSHFFKTEWFEHIIELEFEGKLFFAPKDYDKVLKSSYGDYMKLPPEKDRRYSHHLEGYRID